LLLAENGSLEHIPRDLVDKRIGWSTKESTPSHVENYWKQRGSRSSKLNESEDEYVHSLLNPNF